MSLNRIQDLHGLITAQIALPPSKDPSKRIRPLVEAALEEISAAQNPDAPFKKEVRALFFSTLSSQNSAVFDRTWLGDKIDEKLLAILAPKLFLLKEEKKQTPKMAFDPAHRLKRKIAKAKFAVLLGIQPEKSPTGIHRAAIYTDYKGKKLGIFKTGLEKSQIAFFKRLVQWLLSLMGFRAQKELYRSQAEIPSMYSELAASSLDTFFQFHFIPTTGFACLQNQVGSFMIWEKRGMSAAEWNPEETPTSYELDLFQAFIIADYLLGNADRHRKNWHVRLYNGRLIQITAIDNGNAFIEKNPKESYWDWIARKSQYAWKTHPFAKEKFTKVAREMMTSITEQRVEEFIQEITQTFGNKGKYPEGKRFLSAAMLKRLRERGAVLRTMAKKSECGPEDLAKLYSSKAIRNFLNPVV